MIAIGRTFRTEVNSMLDNVGAWALAIQGFVSQNREAIKSMLTFALKLTGVIAVFASVGVAIMGLMTPIGAVSAAIALFGGLWYLNMWDIRDKTKTAIDKIVGFWGILKETTQSTVNNSIEKWNELKEWWQNTTWIEKAQDIGEITLAVAGWGFDEGKKITQSLKEWIEEKYGVELTVDNAIDAVIGIGEFTFDGMKNLASDFSSWFKQKVMPSDGSIEEQIEREMGNSGIGELLKAVYRAEGGKDASVPYGTTVFEEKGGKFGKQANQAFFDGLVESMGIEEGSQGWYAASSATTINHYWDNFKDNYELAADQTLASLSEDMQDKFIKYLGSNYAPPEHHPMNENWIPNVSEFYNSEMSDQFSAGSINETIQASIQLQPFFDVTYKGAKTAIEAVAEFFGWVSAKEYDYNLGKITAEIIFGTVKFTADTISTFIDEIFTLDLEEGDMSAEIGKLTLNVAKFGWNFMQGFSDSFWEAITGKNSAELGQDTNNWIDLNLDGNADKVKPHMAKATGGYISGAGTSTSDSIPAMLSNGEYVINAASTSKWRPILEAINSGNFSGFRRGGPIEGGYGSYVPPEVMNIDWASEYPSTTSYSGVGSTESINMRALKDAGIDNKLVSELLTKLAGIAKDTENFKYMIDLVSGFEEMKKAYQKEMESKKSDWQDAFDQLMEDYEDLKNEGEKFNANLSNLTSELSSFANNIANVTGNETAGLVGSLIGSGKGMYDQFQNFKKSDDFMSQITSGFGMANAALGAVSAFKSWNESRNEKAQQYWQEQLELDREQLDNIKQIESNTKETTANLVKYLSQNPTNSNIAGGKSVLDDVYNSLRGNLRPDFGQIAYNVKEEDVFFDDEKTKRYNPESFLKNQMGINTPGSLSGMGVDQLQSVYDQVRNVSGSQLKGVAQDIADTMDNGLAGSGELKSWSSNFGSFKTKLGNYLKTLKDLESTLGSLQENARLESFAGVEFLNASERVDQYRKQVEDFFKASGKSISSHQSEIDAMVNEYADKVVDGGERIITIMRDVRSSFIQAFSGGESALSSLSSSLQPYFDTLKSNIASIFYDIEIDQLDAQLKSLFGKLTDRLANYSGDNPLDFAESILQTGSLKNVFANIIDISENMEDMESINDIIIEQFTDQAKAAGMTEEEIDNLLEKMGLLSNESKEITQQMQQVQNALSDAMDAALESEDLFDFKTALGESIYESAKDGLIQAFMESEVYQEMFSKWFDGQDINFTGDLEQDFDNMQGILDSLQDELREAGMDFDTTKVPTADDSTSSDDYYGGSGIPEGEGGGTVNNYTYEFAPHNNTFIGTDREDLYKEFLKWIKDKEDDEA